MLPWANNLFRVSHSSYVKGVNNDIYCLDLLEEFNEKTCKALSTLWLPGFNKQLLVDRIMVITDILILQWRAHTLIVPRIRVMSKTHKHSLCGKPIFCWIRSHPLWLQRHFSREKWCMIVHWINHSFSSHRCTWKNACKQISPFPWTLIVSFFL